MSPLLLVFGLTIHFSGSQDEGLKLTAEAWRNARSTLNDRFRLQIDKKSITKARHYRGIGPNGEDFPPEDLQRDSRISILFASGNRRLEEVLDGSKMMQECEILILNRDSCIQFTGAQWHINATPDSVYHRATVSRRTKGDELKDQEMGYLPLKPYLVENYMDEFKSSRRRDTIVTLIVPRPKGSGYEVDVDASKGCAVKAIRITANGFTLGEVLVSEHVKSGGVWLPKKWREAAYIHRLREQGVVWYTADFDLTKTEIPAEAPDSEFQLKFPSKTHVRDFTGDSEKDYYID